ncbi:hypothetical protein ACNPKZ_20175 [Shewanella algae]|uniref:hypothetical protein n=1 Tax=Shewanella algae TaxID=38313 RepID=UPI000B3477E5|nr:hypothetical protein KVP08_022700 [Shewanella putrefaciens]
MDIGQAKKKALIDAKSMNSWLTIKMLSELTMSAQGTVESWLYETNSPPFEAIYLVHRFLKRGGGVIPKSLQRVISRLEVRASWFAKKHGQDKTATVEGSNITPRVIHFELDGELVTLTDIQKKTGRPRSSIDQFFRNKGIKSGDKISQQSIAALSLGGRRGRRNKKSTN